jgi:anti-anti-sigma factor
MVLRARTFVVVRHVRPGVCVIDVHGEMTAASEKELMQAYAEVSAAQAQTLILNLGRLEYMNSGGIGLLVMLLVRAQRQGQRVLTFGLNGHYRRLLELTRLNEAMQVFTTEDEALAQA